MEFPIYAGIFKFRNARFLLYQKHGCIGCVMLGRCNESLQMIIERIGCSEKDAKSVLMQMIPDEHIEDLLELHTDDIEENYHKDWMIGEVLSNFSTETILSYDDAFLSVQNKLLHEEIKAVLSTLKPKEEKVLRMRYGLEGPERTLEEIGAEFKVTRERIRQIESKALRKLRGSLKVRRLKDSW